MTDERYRPKNLNDALARLSEECHELGKVACKALRFGLDDKHPKKDKTNFKLMLEEAEDVRVAIKDVIDFHLGRHVKRPDTLEDMKSCDLSSIIGMLRNPYGFSEEELRLMHLAVADILENSLLRRHGKAEEIDEMLSQPRHLRFLKDPET